MGISVGSVTVDIVPDTRNFRRDLDAKTRDLTVNVGVRLNDKVFDGELKEATRDRTVNVRVDSRDALASTHLLRDTLVGLAPAAAPLAGVAIAGAAALAGLGSAGLLAFKGIQAEMKAGTPAGIEYSGIVQHLQTDLQGLEKTAASGVLTGFEDAASAAHSAVPQLRTEVGLLSKSLGSDLAPVTSGLLGLLHDLDPTVNSVAGGIHGLAVDFEDWATGPGGVKFANYLASELPQVERVLGSLATTGAHVVTSLLPLGGPVLTAVEAISDGINHLPVGVIEGLFVAYEGYRTVQLATTATKAFEGVVKSLGLTAGATALKLDGLAASEAAAGGASRGVGAAGALSKAAGPLAAVGFGDTVLTQFLVGKVQGENASDTKGLTGNPQALAAAHQQLRTLQAQTSSFKGSDAGRAGGAANNAALSRIKTLTAEINAAQRANIALGKSADGTRSSILGENTAMTQFIGGVDKAASAAQGLAGATIGVHQALSDANKSFKDNGKTLDLNTQKGRDNRTALLGIASATRTKIDADVASHKSLGKVNGDTAAGIIQLQDMAIKFGLSGTAAHKYALNLLGIPSSVITSITVNGIAKSEAQIKALKKLEGSNQFYANQKGNATGGLITGAGTSTSDSIPRMLSNGEFVVRAAAVKQVGTQYLEALNRQPSSLQSQMRSQTQLVPQMSGVAASGHAAAPTVQMVVNPQPGMSETAVARIAAGQILTALAR